MAGPDSPEASGDRRVAFLGLGIMGRPMAASLRRAGFEVIAWNRTRSRAESFAAEEGATVADTPAEAAARADLVVTMLVDAPHVEAVLFGPNGAAESMEAGTLCVDMSTIAPTASRAIGERLADRGVDFLDAPVTGSRPKAEAGTLTVMGSTWTRSSRWRAAGRAAPPCSSSRPDPCWLTTSSRCSSSSTC
jgi:3-hydroxyisobutyrate dehydrogenase-like beta-hydroxyacid dehydrogenase